MDYFVTSPRFTVALVCDRGVIHDGPPIVRRRWLGKTLGALCAAWRADHVQVLP